MIQKLVRYTFYAILGLQIAGGLLLISPSGLSLNRSSTIRQSEMNCGYG
jgi:hypothetical protein